VREQRGHAALAVTVAELFAGDAQAVLEHGGDRPRLAGEV
jgi:hypothetical protein